MKTSMASSMQLQKQHNKQSLQLAKAIRAKRVVEAQNGEHGFKADGCRFFSTMKLTKKAAR